MKVNRILIIAFSLLLSPTLFAGNSESFDNVSMLKLLREPIEEGTVDIENKQTKVKFKRGKAILFTLFTGILGGHRIYFGTHHRTPIIYSITFGGFGILPLIDLVHIIFTKDLSRYENVNKIMMWRK